MMTRGILLTATLLAAGCTATTNERGAQALADDMTNAMNSACSADPGVALQVLGSGGPIADDARAGTGYLVWDGGKSRFLVDTGSGTMSRFGSAGGSFLELDAVALSHYHVDHTTDLPALLKSGYFAGRKRPLLISGPDASGPFPDLATFLGALIGEGGAYGYLSGYLDGTDNLPALEQRMVAAQPETVSTVYENQATRLVAMGVPHGIVPALAYRLDVDGRSIVFASDQNGNRDAFIDFARDVDVLVMHLVVPEGAAGAARKLHAPPGRIGQIAAAANADTLVLSHFMARSLRDLDKNVARVKESFKGRVVLAEDLLCVPF